MEGSYNTPAGYIVQSECVGKNDLVAFINHNNKAYCLLDERATARSIRWCAAARRKRRERTEAGAAEGEGAHTQDTGLRYV